MSRREHIGGFDVLGRALLFAAATALAGCNMVGPAALASGRGLYNEVINATEDEQILNMIVRQRYDETFGMLDVASVTANVSVRATARSNFQAWGTSSSIDANLVPLSAGVAYEENPTISYVPRAGEKYLARLLERLTLNELILISRGTTDKELWLREAIASVNGLHNPRAYGVSASPDFDRFIDVYGRLLQAHVTNLGQTEPTDGADPRFFIIINDDTGDHADDIRAFLDILGIEGRTVDGGDILLPVRPALAERSADSINVETRSVFDIIRSSGTVIDLPAPHLEAGIVEPRIGEATEDVRFLTIRSSTTRPDDAAVAVRFRDWWFSIDATDTRSKRAFILLRMLLGAKQEALSGYQAPVITIPTR